MTERDIIGALGEGAGGPLPAPTPWLNYGGYVTYPGGATLGLPTGGNEGPGTLNVQNMLYINGQALTSLFFPLTAGPVHMGTVAPSTPTVGTLWWDENGGQLYVWYDDGTSAQWVVANNQLPGVSGYLQLSGGTMTGSLVLNANPTVPLGAATKQYVDTLTNTTIDVGTF